MSKPPAPAPAPSEPHCECCRSLAGANNEIERLALKVSMWEEENQNVVGENNALRAEVERLARARDAWHKQADETLDKFENFVKSLRGVRR